MKRNTIFAAAAIIAALATGGLLLFVLNFASGREEYHSFLPFIVGLVPAVLFGRPTRRIKSPWTKHLVRGGIYVLFIAPVPVGPEGSFMPMAMPLAGCPILILDYPLGPLLTFLAVVSASAALDNHTHGTNTKAPPTAQPRPPEADR